MGVVENDPRLTVIELLTSLLHIENNGISVISLSYPICSVKSSAEHRVGILTKCED